MRIDKSNSGRAVSDHRGVLAATVQGITAIVFFQPLKPHPEPVEIRLTAPLMPPSPTQLQRMAVAALKSWNPLPGAERLTALSLKQLPMGSLVSAMASDSQVQLPEPINVEAFQDNSVASKVFGFRTNRDLQAHINRLNAAIHYTQAVANGNPAPTTAVAEGMALDPMQARNVVSAARLSGYLSKAQQGLAGGDITTAARRFHQELTDYLEGLA